MVVISAFTNVYCAGTRFYILSVIFSVTIIIKIISKNAEIQSESPLNNDKFLLKNILVSFSKLMVKYLNILFSIYFYIKQLYDS